MKHIASAIALFIGSFALVSCGGDKEESVKSHAEVGQKMATIMTELMTDMSKISDVDSAESWAASFPDRKEQVKSLLAAAKALPAPTDEEKAEVQRIMDEAEEKMGPQMMAMMMGLAQNPNAEAIGKVLEGVMKDEEMEQVSDELEALYETEEAPAE